MTSGFRTALLLSLVTFFHAHPEFGFFLAAPDHGARRGRAGALEALRLPLVVGEILAGIAIGYSGLNLVHQTPTLDFLAEFGFAFLMFLSGLEVSFSSLSRSLRDGKNPVLRGGDRLRAATFRHDPQRAADEFNPEHDIARPVAIECGVSSHRDPCCPARSGRCAESNAGIKRSLRFHQGLIVAEALA